MIETTDIRVDYDDVMAVADLSLSVAEGEVFGLIGPNGAGKTSLIRVLATLQEPTYGDVRIAGHDLAEARTEARKRIGYMPDLAPVYKDLKCWEFLDLFARAHFVSRPERWARIEDVIALVDLDAKRDAMAGTLSRGMTQRLVLAKTLLHDPSVLLLDEPASGLDPLARIELRNLMKRLASTGKTILISSHILNELSEFCTSIGVMQKGRLLRHGPIDEIVAGLGMERRIVIETIGPAAAAQDVVRANTRATIVTASDGRCEFEAAASDEELATTLAELVRQGVRVKAFYERRRGVEDVLMQLGASEVS